MTPGKNGKPQQMTDTVQHPICVTEHDTVYEDRLRRIYRKDAEFEGYIKQYLVSDTGERAAVLVARGSYILLVMQYRLLINDISLEIPGGKVDTGESAEIAAIRECQEETGVECKNLKVLLNYYPGLDVTYNPTYIFYSNEVVPTTITRNERSVWLPLDVCLNLVFNGKIQDAMTIIGLLTYSVCVCNEWKMKGEYASEINPVCARIVHWI